MRRLLPVPLVWLTLSVGVADAGPVSAREALASLNALHAVLGAGLDYAEYQHRLASTTTMLDQYAERKPVTVPEAEAKTALSSAMNYHRFALSLWAARLQRDGELSLSAFDPLQVLVERFPCPALQLLVETVMRTYRPRRSDGGNAAIAVDRRWSDRVVPVLWSCASDKIAEAERVIGTTTR
jgi:hypothetical protein